MEKWQKVHICKNLAELQELTDCNVELIALLQAEEMINKTDIDMLNARFASKGKIAQSSYLYVTLQTRLSGYKWLTKSLLSLKQTGAAKILLDGFLKNGVMDPLTRCKITIDFKDMLSSHVWFQGRLCRWQEAFKELNIEDLKEIMKTGQHEQEYMNYFLFKKEKFTLVSDTVPKRPPFYIPRSISNRVKLDPKLFQENCPDIFVFREIDRAHLSQLAGLHLTSTSDKQLLDISRRFVLLNDYPDWEQMRKISKKPIHLIKLEVLKDMNGREAKEFVLEETHGSSAVLWNFILTDSKSEKLYLTEQEFFDKIEEANTSKGICICDTPGMGKTFLLGSIARSLQKRYPERVIAFIHFAEFLFMFSQHRGKSISGSLATNMILQSVCSSPIAHAILLKQINKTSCRMDLFLDGLDEVPVEYFQMAASFLKSVLGNATHIRVYVTSRPHLKRQLEQVLGVTAYDILPFTTNEQVNYLVKMWNGIIPNRQKSKLTTFATQCLDSVRKTVNKSEGDIMGVPLQCYILANLYIDEAKLYSDPARKSEPQLIKSSSVYEMYKNFLEMRFSSVDEKERTNAKSFHTWLALMHLCPPIDVAFALYQDLKNVDFTPSFLACGIVEISWSRGNIVIKFIHRTLAEFIVSDYLKEVLLTKNICEQVGLGLGKQLISWFVRSVLSIGEVQEDLFFGFRYCRFDDCRPKFTDSVIIYFLNEGFGNINSFSLDTFIGETFFMCLKPENIFRILQATIIHDFHNFFRFFQKMLLQLSDSNSAAFKSYILKKNESEKTEEFTDKDPLGQLMCSACTESSLASIENIFILFLQCFNTDLNEICSKMRTVGKSLLETAIYKMDYENLEFLLQKFPTANQGLLYYWMANIRSDGNIDLDTREIEIFKLLRSKIKNLLNEPLDLGSIKFTGPLGSTNLSFKVIKFLVSEGADVYATAIDNNGKISTIVHNSLDNGFSRAEFPELCRFLIKDCKAFDLFKEVDGKWSGTIHDIITFHSSNEALIQMIIDIPGFNANEKRQYTDDSVLMTAVLFNLSKCVIDKLIDRGASLQNEEGTTVLHYAANNDNIEYIDYFLAMEIDINSCSIQGHTPIHRGAPNLYTLKYLLSKGADPFAIMTDGNNIVHQICTVDWIPKNDLHDLLLFVSGINGSNILFNAKNMYNQTPLHLRLQTVNDGILDETFSLFKLSKEVVNTVEKMYGHNLLFSALSARHNLDIIKRLVHLGADCKLPGTGRMNATDIAKQNVENLRRSYNISENLEKLERMEEVFEFLSSIYC